MANADANLAGVETPNREDDAAEMVPQQGNTLTEGGANANNEENNGGTGDARIIFNPLETETTGETVVKKSRFGLEDQHVPREEDQDKWVLPEELAVFFAENTRRHVPDRDMKKFMQQYPTPSNVNCVPHLDDSARKSLKDKNLNAASDLDEDFVMIQEKIQDVMGPLGAAWGTLKLVEAGDIESTQLNAADLIDQLQKAVILVGHAMHKVSWHRRVSVLSALGKVNGAKITDVRSLLKQEKIQEIFLNNSSGDLFSAKFDEVTKTEKTSRSNFGSLFQKKESKKEPKPSKGANNNGGFRPGDKRPFSASPLQKGGGFRQDSSSNSSGNFFRRGGGNQYHRNSSSNMFRGGYNKGKLNSETFCKHAPTSNMALVSTTCASDDKGYFSYHGGYFSIGGKNSKVLGQLETSNDGQEYSEYSQGLGGAIIGPTYSNPFASGYKNEQSRGEGHGPGSREHACKRSHQGGHSEAGPVSKQRFCNSEKGRGGVSAYHQSERSESICSLPPFQDGGVKGRKEPSKGRRLDVQNGPERRLLFSPSESPLKETGSVSMERNVIRIPKSSFWSGARPKDLHKTHEGSHFLSEKTGSVPGHLPGRPAHNGAIKGKTKDGAGYNYVPVSSPWTYDKSQKVLFRPNSENRVFGGDSGQRSAHLLSAREEDQKVDFKV